MDDLAKILALARKFKAVRIKVGDIEVQMSPDAWSAPPVAASAEPSEPSEEEPTADDLLFWSTK